jgi:hypothetical protein
MVKITRGLEPLSKFSHSESLFLENTFLKHSSQFYLGDGFKCIYIVADGTREASSSRDRSSSTGPPYSTSEELFEFHQLFILFSLIRMCPVHTVCVNIGYIHKCTVYGG